MFDWLENIDRQLFLLLNGFHNSFFDGLVPWLTGNLVWLPLYFWLIFLLYKKYSKKDFLLSLCAITLSLGFTDLTSVRLFKNVIQRFRPCH